MCRVRTARCFRATKIAIDGWKFRCARAATTSTTRTRLARGRSSAAVRATPAPIDNDTEVLRRAIWLETDKQYRSAAEALIKIKTGKEVKVETAEGAAPDFTHEQPHTDIGPEVSIKVDRTPWEAKVRAYTKEFRSSPAVINSIVTFTAQAQNAYQITSEGTQLQYGQIRYRLELFIQGKAPDGMDLERYYNFDWVKPSDAPDDKAVLAAGATLRKELEGLVAAPLNEPSVTPALLTGRAAAVFFHEVFGHRAEGHRQKDASEGQTFAKKVDQPILPDFLTIIDDPTMPRLGKEDLLGFYEYDDEGVKAHRVMMVDHGVLKNFEMSRSPLVGFPHSNGHGRRQLGASPVSRQGNLIVESSKTLTDAQLRAKLIELVKQQQQAVRVADRRHRGRIYVHGTRAAASVPGAAAGCLQGVCGRAAG